MFLFPLTTPPRRPSNSGSQKRKKKKTPTVTQDPLAEKEAPKKMEIVLATLPLPAKIDPASKGPKALETAASQPNKVPPKEKLVIKKK